MNISSAYLHIQELKAKLREKSFTENEIAEIIQRLNALIIKECLVKYLIELPSDLQKELANRESDKIFPYIAEHGEKFPQPSEKQMNQAGADVIKKFYTVMNLQ